MRKIKDKELYVRVQRKKARRNAKRRLKDRRKRKRIGRILQGKDKRERKNWLRMFREYGDNRIRAPKILSLLNNTEETVRFLQRINSSWEKRKPVFVVLKDVEEIDHSATTVLLSLIHRFQVANIKFNGDFPKNQTANKILHESQFFERLESDHPSSKDYTMKRDNQIIGEAGTQTIDPKTALEIREDVSQTITGTPDYVFPTLHPSFIEVMQNTYEHAGEDEGTVHWWLSINHDKSNHTVTFHFIDFGRGIIDSVLNKENNRITKTFKEYAWLLFDTSKFPDIITRLLNNEHKESKVDYYRGKGIPSLKKALDNNRVKCLSIITNRAVVNVAQNITCVLQTDFTGTYITWVLNNECGKKLWNKK